MKRQNMFTLSFEDKTFPIFVPFWGSFQFNWTHVLVSFSSNILSGLPAKYPSYYNPSSLCLHM